MKLKKQKVYIPTKVVLDEDTKMFCRISGLIPTKPDLKPQQGYFLTESELRELLENTWRDSGDSKNFHPNIKREDYINNLLKEE